jgi:hypothetical protein
MRQLTSVLLGFTMFFGSGAAVAQEFGAKGDLAFGAERLFGIQGTHTYRERPVADQPDIENDYTTISFGWRPANPEFSPFDAPRLAFDVFIIDHLSLGGALGYSSVSAEGTNGAPGPQFGDDATYSSFIFAPRVGYAFMFSQVVGLWPRGGFAYHSRSLEDDHSEYGLSFGVDAMLVIAPVRHFGFLIGPSFDIDFAGERDPDNGPDVDRRFRSFGLQAGLFGWL